MNFLILTLLILLLDVISWWGVERTFPRWSGRHAKGIRKALMIQAAVATAIVLGGLLLQYQVRQYRVFACYYGVFGLLVTLYAAKSFYALFLFFDWAVSGIRRGAGRRLKKSVSAPCHTLSRGGFFGGVAVGGLVLWGVLFGRFQFTVDRVELAIDGLPAAFDGYRVVQISDIHAGSFAGFTHRLRQAVDLINWQEPDLVVFTGDMVNNFAEEAVPLIPIFSQLKARDGKYAVLGNHDYGGYFDWHSPVDSVMNRAELDHVIEQMGVVLLKNQSTVIRRNGDRMALVGIENWGQSERHPKRGDLAKAMKSGEDGFCLPPFRILLSHDPSFWPEYVEGKVDIALTLSGHTHGMQMGVKLGNQRYCPSRLLGYRYGTGLYGTGRQRLYVNRGLGVIGYLGRIGMPPEITMITLRNSRSPAQP